MSKGHHCAEWLAPVISPVSLATKALEAAHLRQISFRPQVKAPRSGRNPGKFHTAVWDLIWSK
jgi:hypothetical protein